MLLESMNENCKTEACLQVHILALIKSNKTSSQDTVCCRLGSLTKGAFRASNDVPPSQVHRYHYQHIARRTAVSQGGNTSTKDKLAPV